MTRTTYLSQTRVGFLLSLPFICPVGSKEWKVFLLLTSVLLYSISATSIHLLDPRQLCEASPSFYSYYSTTDQICWLFFLCQSKCGFLNLLSGIITTFTVANMPTIFLLWLTVYLSTISPPSLLPSIRPDTVSPLLPHFILSLIGLAFSAQSSIHPSFHPSFLSPSCCPSL